MCKSSFAMIYDLTSDDLTISSRLNSIKSNCLIFLMIFIKSRIPYFSESFLKSDCQKSPAKIILQLFPTRVNTESNSSKDKF